jgi:hypothetical protein
MRRKHTATLVALFLCALTTFAQTGKKKITLGIKSGINLSTFRTPAHIHYNDYDPNWEKIGFVIGGSLETILNKSFDFEVNALYSAMGSKLSGAMGEETHRFNYLSVPLLVKFKFAKNWRVMAGLQGDILFNAKRIEEQPDRTSVVTDRIGHFDFAYTTGVEALLGTRFTAQLRYIHGQHDVSLWKDESTGKNQAIQFTLGYKFNCKSKK